MPEYSRPLGDSVKRARGKLGLTQNEVADLIDIDVRTVLNIENYKGNPKLHILYPLIRFLKIDAREVFPSSFSAVQLNRRIPSGMQADSISRYSSPFLLSTVSNSIYSAVLSHPRERGCPNPIFA